MPGYSNFRRSKTMAYNDFLRIDHAMTNRARPDGWTLSAFRTQAEIAPVLEAVTRVMEERGYSEEDVFEMRLALDEATCNAIRHGHRGDATKEVRIRYHVTMDR